MPQQKNSYQQKKPFTPRPVGAKPAFVSRPAQKPVDRSHSSGFQDRRAPMVFVNENIKAPTIIIIDEEGNNVGTYPRRRALEIAEEAGKDLVQMRYDQENMTSTVKLLDYGKYMYQKQKDEKEKKKTQKNTGLKELKINYAIGENDLQLKIKKAREMLKDGYNVKVLIKLKGREKIYASKAVEKILFVKDALVDVGRSQFDQPKQEIHGYSIILFSK
ncbi:MAG: translation initiation factor IF-3 [Candidatus Absconditabacteria bacterium]|nr:translation initiation factor IF-3 [Candidatus Absconditabacteria bacterium]